MQKKKIKVMVAMSGGVDSSVSAFLLREKGYDVAGVFMKLNSDRTSELAAKNVALRLGIGFKVIDLRKKFAKEIISYFLKSYQAGLTPNPCVLCNKTIKFGELLKFARINKADFLATGHYARKVKSHVSPNGGKSKVKSIYSLYKAKDKNKDQSYFLYALSQYQLKHVIFSLGDLTKNDVRKIADENNLPYIKKESQDICFLNVRGKRISTEEFLKKNLKLKPGQIKTTDGKIIGRHQGLPLYTIGQRKGIDIGGTGPYYVTGFDRQKNILFVTNELKNSEIFKSSFYIKNVNWTDSKIAKFPLKCEVGIRYRQKPVKCIVRKVKNVIKVEMDEPQRAVTPGQSAVFYQDNQVLGGGEIVIDK